MPRPPARDDVPAALAGIFDKKKISVSVSGGLDTNEHTDKLDGAHIEIEIGPDQPEPPLTEYMPP
jgi:hypothetical protein